MRGRYDYFILVKSGPLDLLLQAQNKLTMQKTKCKEDSSQCHSRSYGIFQIAKSCHHSLNYQV